MTLLTSGNEPSEGDVWVPGVRFFDFFGYYIKNKASQTKLVSQNKRKEPVKQNHTFVMAAIEKMREVGTFDGFDEVNIWSDGGPAHFKIYWTQFEMTEWQARYPSPKITWDFFWAHRGHNMCDGHAGVLKAKVREQERNWILVLMLN